MQRELFMGQLAFPTPAAAVNVESHSRLCCLYFVVQKINKSGPVHIQPHV